MSLLQDTVQVDTLSLHGRLLLSLGSEQGRPNDLESRSVKAFSPYVGMMVANMSFGLHRNSPPKYEAHMERDGHEVKARNTEALLLMKSITQRLQVCRIM